MRDPALRFQQDSRPADDFPQYHDYVTPPTVTCEASPQQENNLTGQAASVLSPIVFTPPGFGFSVRRLLRGSSAHTQQCLPLYEPPLVPRLLIDVYSGDGPAPFLFESRRSSTTPPLAYVTQSFPLRLLQIPSPLAWLYPHLLGFFFHFRIFPLPSLTSPDRRTAPALVFDTGFQRNLFHFVSILTHPHVVTSPSFFFPLP